MDRRIERIVTEDGSHTYRDMARDITFRSVHGARTESRTVFVDGCGLSRRGRGGEAWEVLELGFGGARNFGETVLRARDLGVAVRYRAVERAPLPIALLEHDDDQVTRMARAALENPATPIVEDDVEVVVYAADWRDAPPIDLRDVHAVYHDPFAPSDDPACWTVDCFRWSRELAGDRTVLGTYSAATAVKDAMAAAGWWVASAPGPGRKREVTFASPSPDLLKRWELVREPK